MNANTVRRLAVFICVSLLASTAAIGALPPKWNTIGPYMTLHLQGGSTEEGAVELYLTGLGDGFITANAVLSQSGQAPLFCTPDIEFNGKNYRSMLDQELQDMVQRDKARKPGTPPLSTISSGPISILLLQALQNKFPCEKK